MLVNNPMGSRRRRRFYHRAGVVPVPGGRFKADLDIFDFFRRDPDLSIQEGDLKKITDVIDYNLSALMTQEAKHNGEFIKNLNAGLLDFIDSMIMSEFKDELGGAKLNKSKKAKDKDIGQPTAAKKGAKPRTAPAANRGAGTAADPPANPAGDESYTEEVF